MAFYSYQHDDRAVCADCFSDIGIKRFVEENAVSEECSFCGATSDEPIAAPLDEVVEFIEQGIRTAYGNPDECAMSWDQEDQRYYPGKTYDTDELLYDYLDLPLDEDGSLFEAISRGLDNDLWCDIEQYALSENERLQYSWDHFCRVIKHERRFFFSNYSKYSSDGEIFSPDHVLAIIFEYAETIGLIHPLKRGTRLYRVRRVDGDGRTALDLGPPPPDKARQQNRMSPAGISMLYASEDPETALRETVDKAGIYTVAAFVTERDATVIDFSKLSRIPSIFEQIPDSMEYDPRKLSIFLHTFREEISKPIVRDDRVHIEYAPTQVVTEYLRTMKTREQGDIDGIVYGSARHAGGASVVLFCDPKSLILPEDQQDRQKLYNQYNGPWIRLVDYEDRAISDDDLKCWNDEAPKLQEKPYHDIFDEC